MIGWWLFIIASVLGSIYGGLASVSEAAALGVAGVRLLGIDGPSLDPQDAKDLVSHQALGLIDNWLRAIKALYHQSLHEFEGMDDEQRVNRLCELNVQRQVRNVCHTTIVQNAWMRGQDLTVYGWIYGLENGLIKDLDSTISAPDQLDEAFLYEL